MDTDTKTAPALAVALLTFKILTADLLAFRKAFAKLARKATRLGVEVPTYEELGTELIPATKRRPAAQVTSVTVTGQAPKLDGWTFAASIQHTPEGNIIRAVPGVEGVDFKPYREVDSNCDHCRVRRNRNDTYVVVSDDGKTLQVGRSCLKDFTGHKSPEAIARWAELLSVFVEANEYDPDSYGMGSGGQPWLPLAEFLPQVCSEIRRDGWLSKTVAREQDRLDHATASAAWWMFFGMTAAEASDLEVAGRLDGMKPNDADKALAAEVLQYAAEYFDGADADGTELGDYEWNLRMVVQGGSVDARQSGLAASLVPWMTRKLGREAAREQRQAQRAASQHVGTVGKRQDFEGIVVERIHSFEGSYGWTHIHLMLDAAGNRLVWKSSRASLTEGKRYGIRGTVKDHDEYKGEKQTILTRCKAEEVEGEPA